jgi:hypothetical protein
MDAPRSFTAAVVAVFAALAVGGCGGDESNQGGADEPLSWLQQPRVLVPPELEQDRILRADVRNDSDETIEVDSSAVRVLDERGHRLKAAVTFAAGYLHPLYPPTRGPATLPDEELERLGRLAKIEPGKAAAITVSWREPRGKRTAARIDYGGGSLAIPPEVGGGADEEF